MKTVFSVLFIITGFLNTLGCSSNQQPESPKKPLSDFELIHGMGPVTSVVNLQEFNPAAAKRGQEIFSTTCTACHKMNENTIGPKLGDVLERRSPAFVMNMILNPSGMNRNHPEARQMMHDYRVVMPYQNLTREQARSIIEYLRPEFQDDLY